MGNFLPGEAVNHLPKKFSHVAQISTKQHRPHHGIWRWLDTVCKGHCLPSSSLNYVAIKKPFGKIATTVVLDKDENLSWSGLQWHRSCQSNELTPLPILLAAMFLGTRNCSYKIVHGSFFLQYGRLDVLEVKAESVRTLSSYFRMKFLSLEIRKNGKILMFGRYL